MGDAQTKKADASSRSVILFPFMAAIFPILSVLSSNAPDVPLSDLLLPISSILGASLLLWFILGLLLRDPRKRGLILLALLILFWSYGALLDLVRAALNYRESISGLRILPFAALEFGIAAAIFIYLRRTRRSLVGLTHYLNVATCGAITVAIGSTTYDYARAGGISALSLDRGSVAAASSADSRDIVYIIADAYGRHDTIRDVYGYDNTPFVEALEDRGFYVARESRANYNTTRFSISSSMNYDYVNGIASELGGDQSTVRLIQESRLLRWLETHGYKITSFATGYTGTELHQADEYLQPKVQLTEFQQALVDKTPLRSVMNRVRSHKAAKNGRRSGVHDLHRARVLFALKNLREMKWSDQPEFVFTHVISPHWPFVLDELGNPVYPAIRYNLAADYPDWEKPTLQEFTEGYRKQVQGLNRLLLETIDAVQESNPDAIIILQGDHGPRRRVILPDPEPWQTYAREELAILNAYYLPGVEAKDILYPRISPVNTFRVILNTYFQEDLPLLEDRSFLWIHLDSEAYPVPQSMLDSVGPAQQIARSHAQTDTTDSAK